MWQAVAKSAIYMNNIIKTGALVLLDACWFSHPIRVKRSISSQKIDKQIVNICTS